MIYFIEAVGANKLKIGYTVSQPEKRLKELQTGCPHKLKLIFAIEGDQDGERELHSVLAHLRENGEWFRYEGELRLLLWILKRFDRPFAFWASELKEVQQRVDEHERELFPDRDQEDVDDPDLSAIDHLSERLSVEEYFINQDRKDTTNRLNWHEELIADLQHRVLAISATRDAYRPLGGDCRM